MPVAGGMKDTPISTMGVLTNLAHESGRRRWMIQKGNGSNAPPMIAYSWGLYIDCGPNCLLGPIRPLHKKMSTRRQKIKKNTLYQIAEAAKNTWLCGHVKWLGWSGVQMSGTVEKIHCLTPTCRNAERIVATSCTVPILVPTILMNAQRGGLTMEGCTRRNFDVVPKLQVLYE